MRISIFAVVGVLAASTLSAQSLPALKADILVSTDTVQAGTVDCGGFVGVQVKNVPNSSDGNACVARVYNLTASPAFTVWKSSATLVQIGDAIVSTELAGLSSLNLQRLQAIASYGPNGINPSLTDRRAAFDDIFSGAGGALTRPRLLALWKRLATRVEKLYATGTGSDPSPATLVFEGAISGATVNSALNLP